ncbi:MAG: MBL fold metallo-hydrolase [Candidatus Eisenbacteria bacterium]|nr:MBL fold metallo-hydrolase [Candidatus Eisenbacteria bacterium]
MASTSIRLGPATLTSLDAGVFYYDGGAMFGGVPKVLWETLIPADAKNRIPLTISPLLVRTPSRTVLVDTGFGGSQVAKDVKYYGFDPSVNVATALAAEGVAPEDVDTVVLTHLHSDHAAAATTLRDDGRLTPTFPRARYVVHEAEWKAAFDPDPRSAAAYRGEDFAPLREGGLLDLVGDRADLGDGVSVERTGGHTAGHLMAVIANEGGTAIYPADLVPSRYHVRIPYVAGIDLFPLDVIARKQEVLRKAVDEEWIVILDHDAIGNIGRIVEDAKGRFVFRDLGR